MSILKHWDILISKGAEVNSPKKQKSLLLINKFMAYMADSKFPEDVDIYDEERETQKKLLTNRGVEFPFMSVLSFYFPKWLIELNNIIHKVDHYG
ncbi:hypothetical protein M0811_00642 [Anaeramoeba ignava]|uniref:Uncharacterized protein n=1 Tax=Anaeramoeba ignava TaxID=1746090 RepID=A0A9Q0LKD5_ANAIG|nr:hypothetical protein M0811_00642 [Anaeramoeba ignava]